MDKAVFCTLVDRRHGSRRHPNLPIAGGAGDCKHNYYYYDHCGTYHDDCGTYHNYCGTYHDDCGTYHNYHGTCYDVSVILCAGVWGVSF
jgi:hypothetical protein